MPIPTIAHGALCTSPGSASLSRQLLAVCALAWSLPCLAQKPLTIQEAVEQALQKYPSLEVSLEQVSSAAAAVNLARTSYLPRADFVGQLNRATRNNVSGLLLPQPVISPISGPVLPDDRLLSVWGSATGVLVSWEPFDFGLRRATVEAAEAARSRAESGAALTRLQVSTAAADAFLSVLAAEQSVRAAQASVDRARVVYQVVEALVKAKLRPGAEAARMRAEVAVAETQRIQAEQAVKVARAALAHFLGVPSSDLSLQPGPLLGVPPAEAPVASALRQHPAIQEQAAAVDEIKARERALERSFFPRFNLQGTTFARGTGSKPEGTTKGGWAGLGPNIQNWALGLTVTFPVFELPSLRARREIEVHRERAQQARREQIVCDLAAQADQALAALEAARRIAENTPVRLEAARAAEQQATARYRAGLGNIVEVADAERLLAQSEMDDSLARLNVWRALLAVASVHGDLTPFLHRAAP